MTATIGNVYFVLPLVELVCKDLSGSGGQTSVCTGDLQGDSKIFHFRSPQFLLSFLKKTWC